MASDAQGDGGNAPGAGTERLVVSGLSVAFATENGEALAVDAVSFTVREG